MPGVQFQRRYVVIPVGRGFGLFAFRLLDLVLRLLGRFALGLLDFFLFRFLLAFFHYRDRLCGVFCERSRRQKGEDHEQCQKQTENSAQTMVFHLEMLSFHLTTHAGGTDRLHGNAIITFMSELYSISRQKSMEKDVVFLQSGKKTGPSP